MTIEAGSDVLLTTGSLVNVRPLVSTDEAGLIDLYRRANADSLRLRFFTYSPHAASADVARMLRPPSIDHVALVLTQRAKVIGVGCVERTATHGTGEFALLVDDDHHGEGAGTVLVEQLVAAAGRAGFRALHAEVLTENTGMLKVLRQLGADTTVSMSSGVVDIDFSLDIKPAWQNAVDIRESIAEHASLEKVLAPRRVAVVGAGSSPDGIGHRILDNLVEGGFTGDLYAVNRSGSAVCGVQAYRTVRALPTGLDLVIIAVPAISVLGVVQDCAKLEVGGAVIISDGFAEIDKAGGDQQNEVLRVAREAGMRLVGPNCLGVVSTDPAIRLNATFADIKMVTGSVAIASQSGGVGLALLEHFAKRGVGVSSFVSMGNKADVSGNDLLMRWEHDPRTDVCVLYLESFGNARKFARIARRVGRTKPVVAVTAGRSVAGARGVRSHTAAAATPDVAVDALFAQAGVIRADSMSDIFGVVELLRQKTLPQGPRVGIVTNGGGPGALAADACAAAGLLLPELSPHTQRRRPTFQPACRAGQPRRRDRWWWSQGTDRRHPGTPRQRRHRQCHPDPHVARPDRHRPRCRRARRIDRAVDDKAAAHRVPRSRRGADATSRGLRRHRGRLLRLPGRSRPLPGCGDEICRLAHDPRASTRVASRHPAAGSDTHGEPVPRHSPGRWLARHRRRGSADFVVRHLCRAFPSGRDHG